MAQTAHASTFGGFTVHATGQQSQRSSEQCDDHEDGLSPTHRGQASYFSRVAARRLDWDRNYGIAMTNGLMVWARGVLNT
jgi:hypothetical protein